MFMISQNLNIKSSIVNYSHAAGLFLISPQSCEIFQKMFFNRKESLSCFKYRRRKVGRPGKIVDNRWNK